MAGTKNEEKALDFEALRAKILAEVKEELREEVKAEAKAEMAKIAKKKEGEDKPYQETEEEKAKANELVKLKLFKDKDKYKDDVLVILNGQSYLIKRGVTAEIPRKVYDVLKCSDEQTGVAADIISRYEEEYEESKGALN